MTNGSNDRLDRIEALLQQSIIASDERMTRLEQSMERQSRESNERMTRFEQGLERLEQISESNNRFLKSFSADLRLYTDTMNNLATRIAGVIGTNNHDLQESSRIAAIQRQVSAIARHFGVI